MKKMILLVGCLGLLIGGVINLSCSKDDDKKSNSESNKKLSGCKCTITWDDGDKYTEAFSIEDMEDEGIKTCSALAKYLKEEDDEIEKISCTDLYD
jgi:mannitol/fructose-specific phosphotransferase system IIA component